MELDYRKLHKLSVSNRADIEKSENCGCFHCLRTFRSEEVKEWCDPHGVTALCPFCGIDSVLGDAQDIDLTPEMLRNMHSRYFE